MLRSFGIRLFAAVFGTCSLLFALSLAFVATFGTPDTMKQALLDSKVYDSISGMLASSTNAPNNSLGSQVLPGIQPIQDKQALARSSEVQAAAKNAITPQSAQKAADQTIDGIYRWLDGTASQPDFKVDVQPIRQRFLDNLAQAYDKQFASLPVCTASQLQQFDPTTKDPASITCIPPGIDREQLQKQAIDHLTASNSLLQQPVFTADSLPKDSQGRNIFQRAPDLPGFFQFMQRLPLVSAVVGLVCAILIFVIQRRWRPSIKPLAIALFSSSVSLVVIGCILGLGLRAFMASNPLASLGGQASGLNVVGSVVGAMAGSLTHVIFMWSGIYLLASVAAWVALRLTRPQPAPADTPLSAPAGAGTPPAGTDSTNSVK